MRRKIAWHAAALAVGIWSLLTACSAQPAESVKVDFVDAVLREVNGRDVRFRELVRRGGGPVLISFTYTGCQSLCPVSDLIMAGVEAEMAGTPGVTVRLVTLSIDPFNDSVSILAKRASEIDPTSKRYWLTGEPGAVFATLEGLGYTFGKMEDHSAAFLVVSPSLSVRRVTGQPDPKRLLALARELK
jgi:protein SCO1